MTDYFYRASKLDLCTMSHARYVSNRFVAVDLSAQKFDPDPIPHINKLLPGLNACAARTAMPTSSGKQKPNYSVYTGLGGIALTFLRLGLYCRDKMEGREAECLSSDYLLLARDTALACLQAKPVSSEVSFFCGTPGHLAILCIVSHTLRDDAAANGYLSDLLQWVAPALKHSEDELLFGRAGYLYALLWVRHQLGLGGVEGLDTPDLDTPLRHVAEQIVTSGKMSAEGFGYEGWPMMWHCFESPYLGAAHGATGILTMLFHCFCLLSTRSQHLVVGTLEKLLATIHASGNLPIQLRDEHDKQVHWCHGASGLPGLAQAAEPHVSGTTRHALREAALKAGEVVWERGVILKGTGLCHGVAGNAYAFLTLYRLTGDGTHLLRARAFAELTRDTDVLRAQAEAPDRQRKVPGVPDSPCSLMEGSAGLVCFLLDANQPAKSAFPGWEL
ncbi:hypothetical protein CYMTET_42130 [Cymbomonas tetramitiformis]|uniref:Uncharacterized protein n=1 Tax=Cymbomonas tetramitiformis TaxID=36881 RepID=A0AAE0C6F1_9CHLO|nr:hypothetical protein CYMTET_42130 [Cymbomonas tetramitiformis]